MGKHVRKLSLRSPLSVRFVMCVTFWIGSGEITRFRMFDVASNKPTGNLRYPYSTPYTSIVS